MIFNRQNSA